MDVPGLVATKLDVLRTRADNLHRARLVGRLEAAVIAILVDSIRDAPRDVTLVLDDYHVIESVEIQKSVANLLAQRPAGLTVVLCSRSDPPLPLPRVRADGWLVELRVEDLRFNGDEVSSVLLRSWGLDLSAENVAALEARPEGWAAGLQLAAVALRGAPDMEATARAFAGTHRFVLDYLSDEVLDRQSEPVRAFLLGCSILDRLSRPLCDAVLARSDSQQMLERLDQANLFVIPLDDQRCWYRFHHLFGDLLRGRLTRLDAESVPDLHRRAGRWCEQHVVEIRSTTR